MSEIQVQKEKLYSIMSMEVAQMVEKTHNMLLRDIRRYCSQLGEVKIDFTDFFVEHNYFDSQNREKPCYLVTKQGCEFIAHKLTGTKGTAFTAKYIMRFHQMEEALKEQQNAQATIAKKDIKLIQKADNWYTRNNSLMKMVCKKYKLEAKELSHQILLELGNRYYIDGAKCTYAQEVGYRPRYSFDIVDYFPQLGEEATAYLEYLLNL